MNKNNTMLKYSACVLYGIFTADLVYRISRYVMAYLHATEELPKIVALAVTAVGDTYSGLMHGEIVVAVLFAVLGRLSGLLSWHTVVFLGMNIAGGTVFIAILNWINVPWRILFSLALVSFGTYIISCFFSEISAACDLYKYFFNLKQGENTDDSTT